MVRNVLYASHTPALKGSAVSLFHVMQGIDRARFQPVAAFSKDGYLAGRLEAEGIKCHIVKNRGLLGWRLIGETLNILERERIALVHLNSAVPFCKYVGIAARIRRIPVVWHIREDPAGKRVRRLKKWIKRLSTRIFVVSSELEKAFEGCDSVTKIYNGVDIEKFKPEIESGHFRERFGIPNDAFVFGMVGTIERRKGSLLFLQAAECLLEAGHNAFFMIVGDGLKDDVGKLHAFLEQRRVLSGRTILSGHLENIPEVMTGMDVLVMPSLWEGFPRSLIEAMACGTPSIATDVGEIPWIIEDGKSGFIIPKDDLGSLSAAMKMCLERREALPEMGMRARERIGGEFTIEKHVQTVQSEYGKILGL